MAGQKKIAVVALLIISMLVASSAPTALAVEVDTESPCFKVCFDRCANGKNNDACTSMCAEGCIVPNVLPDGRDPTAIPTGK